jgi:hypothetical protein
VPLVVQADLFGIGRNSVYYLLRPATHSDFSLMRQIVAFYFDYPFAGSCMLQTLLKQVGFEVERTRVRALMRDRGHLPTALNLEA